MKNVKLVELPSALTGVARVEVSVPDKTVEVEFDESVDQDVIAATIEEQGYAVI